MMTREALRALIEAAEGEGIRFISDEIYHGLDYAFPAETAAAAVRQRRHHQFVLQIFLHDRLARRLDGGAGAAGAADRPPAGQSRDLGADAVADRGRGGVRRPRRDGRGQARLRGEPAHPARRPAEGRARHASCRSTARSISMPTCRGSRTTASISPSACWRRPMSRRRPASTSIRCTARRFIRFCYAGSAAEMHEAVERIGAWLRALIARSHALRKRWPLATLRVADKKMPGRDAMPSSSNLRARMLAALLAACAAWTVAGRCHGAGQLPRQADPPDRPAGARQRHRPAGALGLGGGRACSSTRRSSSRTSPAPPSPSGSIWWRRPRPTATRSAWGRSARLRSARTWSRRCPTTSCATSSRSRS